MKSRRSDMTVRIVPQGSAEAGDPRVGGTMEQRIALVEELSRHAWALARRPLPTYTREAIPIRVLSLREADKQDGV
jgi:hypothetical protein